MAFKRKPKIISILLTLTMLLTLGPGVTYAAAPSISNTFATAIDDTTASVNFTPDSDGKAYYAVYPADFGPPAAGQITTPAAEAVAGGVANGLTAAFSHRIDLSGLSPSTAYKAYVIAENAALEQSAMAAIPFDTSWWAADYPQAGTAQAAASKKVQVKAQSRMAGTAYYVVLAEGATAPNYAQIAAGQDGGGNFLATDKKGSISLTADTEAEFTTNALGADATAYDVYLVIKSGVNYSAVKKVDVTTPAAAATPTITGAVMEAENKYITVTFSEGVYGDAAHTTGINKDDFNLTFANNAGVVSGAAIRWVDQVGAAVSPAGGESQVNIKLNLTDGPATGAETITISPKTNSIYNAAGTAVANTETTGAINLNILPAQSFAADYPKAGAVQSSGSHAVQVLAKVDLSGVLNYVVLPDNATAPTAQQIKDHANIDGQPVISWAGQLIGAATELPILLSAGLSHDTDYDVYMVAEAGNNNFSPVQKLNIKTPPATATVINIAAIPDVTAPATGGVPVTAITETAQYTGTVSWSPAAPGNFAAATAYTATITLTPKAGYTLTGVAPDFFTVAGATTVSNPADSGVVTAVFPVTAPLVSDFCAIGATGYPTLDAALAAIGDATPTTIKLLQDITVTRTETGGAIPVVGIANRQIAFDLNNHTLTIKNTSNSWVDKALSVQNSTITFSGPGSCNLENYREHGLYTENSTIALTNAAVLHVKGAVNGVQAYTNSDVTVTSAEQTADNGSAADARTGSRITVKTNATAKNYAVYATGAGSKVQVDDDATSSDSTGVYVSNQGEALVKGDVSGAIGCEISNGGTITIDGSLSGSSKYIRISSTDYSAGNTTTPTSKPGYLTYGSGIYAAVWVKDTTAPGGPTGPAVWHTRAPLPSSEYMSDVRYLNGKYMAVGQNGTLLYSTNGESWQKITVGPGLDHLSGIAYGGGKYVAVGQVGTTYHAGRIFTSSDGLSWHETASVANHVPHDVAYGNGKFVAVGEKGKILSSVDGESWITHTVTYPTGKSTSLLSITYAADKNMFVAGGMRSDTGQTYKGNIMTSTDGISWEFPYSDTNYTIWDVTYGNGKFVTVGGMDTGTCFIATSGDGTTWTKVTSYLPSAQLRAVEWNGSYFVATGFTQNTRTGTALVSLTGAAWTEYAQSTLPSINAVAANATTGRLVAMSGTGNIYTSDDNGMNWNYRTLGTTQTLNDVAWNGSNLYVAVGMNGAIQSSPNGTDWTIRSSGTTNDLNRVDYLNAQFVAVGKNGTVLTSPDGMSWTVQTTGATHDLKGIAYGGGRYVAVGGGVSNGTVILYSGTGETWTTASGFGLVRFDAVAYGDGTFMALTRYGSAYKSADGASWTQAASLSGSSSKYPTDIIYAGGKFAAVGGYGEIYFSSDKGASWSIKDTDLDSYSQGIAHGGGNLVAVGELGKIMASADNGTTWYLQPSNLPINHYTSDNYIRLNGVAAGDNCFVAVGEHGQILQSDSFTVSADADANDVEVDKRSLSIGGSGANNMPGSIVADLHLTSVSGASGSKGCAVTWTSSKPQYVAIDGKVIRPAFGDDDQVVTLTATIQKGTASATKTFIVCVIANEAGALTDAQRVAAAKAALGDGSVTVVHGADQAAKTAAVQSHVNSLLAAVPEAAGVTAIVTYNSGTGEYDIALSKGSASDSRSLDIMIIESADPDIAIVNNAKTAAENAVYSNMTQAAAGSENAIKAALRNTAVTAVNNSNVSVTINTVSYIAPAAGTSANPNGTSGSYTFTVTVSKGSQNQTTTPKIITITATAYTSSGGGDSSSNDIIITSEDQKTHMDNNQTFKLQKDGLHLTIDPDDLPSLAQNKDNIKIDISAVTDTNVLNAFFIQHPGQQGVMKSYSVTLTQQDGSGQSETLTRLNGEITLTFGLTPQELAGIDPSTLMVYKRAEDGSITEYSAEFDWSTHTLSISTNHLCEFFIMGEKGTPTQRLAGTDRYATAAAVSAQGWKTADTVILAGGADFPDALAGTVLAAVKDAPILLTGKDSVSRETLAEIKRLKVKNIFILGGTGVIAKSVEDLLANDYTVMRVSGATRYETAIRIGELVTEANTGQSATNSSASATDTAIIATGSDYPDALSVASFAGQRGMPILFTEKDGLNSLTAQALNTWSIKKVILVGGDGVISDQVENTLRDEMKLEVTRLSGADRYLTGLEIAKYLADSQVEPYRHIALATGSNFPDALAGAALAANLKTPVFLAGKETVSPEVKAYLKGLDLEKIYIFGGQGVIADSIREQIRP